MTNMPKKKTAIYKKIPNEWTPTDRSIYTFTKDFFEQQEYNWWNMTHKWYMDTNRPYKAKIKEDCRILEIGSFEGSAAVWFIEECVRNYNCELHMIDRWLPFNKYEDRVPDRVEGQMIDAESRYDENIAIACEAHLTKKQAKEKIFKWKGDSTKMLYEMTKSYGERSFDIIYIDGSHDQDQVMIDAIMAYKLLDYGGFICFDDYQLNSGNITLGGSIRTTVDQWYQNHREMLVPMYKLSHHDVGKHATGGPIDHNVRGRTRYLDASQAWFRKYKHIPSKARKKIKNYE